MEELAAPFRTERQVRCPDLAGHGPGPHSTDVADYSVDAMAAAVESLVAESFHLAGYSMGGRVALTLACRNPSRVRSLSLIGASAGLATEVERAERAAADDALADRILADGLEDFVDGWMANPLFASQARLGEAYLTASRTQRLTNDPLGLALSLRGGGTGRMRTLHEEIHNCTMPVALIVGDEDTKFREIASQLQVSMPRAAVRVIPESGHATHVEQPAATVAAIRSIIEAAE